jgi:broad specificity phosphatase PhoE
LAQIPQGESLEDVRKRALDLVRKVINRDQGIVILVSHRVVNKVLICAMLGLENSRFWDIRVDTCSITTFVFENGRFILVRHNDTSFLKPIGGTKLNDF